MKRFVFIFLALLIFGCVGEMRKASTEPWIKVVTAKNRYIFLQDGSASEIRLVNYTLELTSLKDGIYYTTYTISGSGRGPVKKVYIIKPGEPVVLIRGTVENDYNETIYAAIFAYGYDSSGRKVSESVASGRSFPWNMASAVKLESGEVKSFELILKYAENLTAVKIFVVISEHPLP